jgi:hypothetical protein
MEDCDQGAATAEHQASSDPSAKATSPLAPPAKGARATQDSSLSTGE